MSNGVVTVIRKATVKMIKVDAQRPTEWTNLRPWRSHLADPVALEDTLARSGYRRGW